MLDTDFQQTLLSWNQFIKEDPKIVFAATDTDVQKLKKSDLAKVPTEIVGIKTEGGWTPTNHFVRTGHGIPAI